MSNILRLRCTNREPMRTLGPTRGKEIIISRLISISISGCQKIVFDAELVSSVYEFGREQQFEDRQSSFNFQEAEGQDIIRRLRAPAIPTCRP